MGRSDSIVCLVITRRSSKDRAIANTTRGRSSVWRSSKKSTTQFDDSIQPFTMCMGLRYRTATCAHRHLRMHRFFFFLFELSTVTYSHVHYIYDQRRQWLAAVNTTIMNNINVHKSLPMVQQLTRRRKKT